MLEYKFQLAEFLLRTFAGILFMLQGYDKLFRITMPEVIAVFTADADKHHIPRPLLKFVVYFTSIVEFLGGIMLVTGLFTTYALAGLGIDLLMVCFAFTYMTPMWSMKYVFPRLVLVGTLLLLPSEYQLFAVDTLLK